MDRYGLIYITYNDVNPLIYVGQTTKIADHKAGKYIGSGVKFLKAVDEIGRSHFKSEPLQYVMDTGNPKFDQKKLDKAEDFQIELRDARNPLIGYNDRKGGHNGKLSEESIAKRIVTFKATWDAKPDEEKAIYSARQSANYHNKSEEEKSAIAEKCRIASSGSNNPMFGKNHSDELKAEHSAKMKGRKRTSESIAKQRATNANKSPEEKAAEHVKRSASNSGKKNGFYGKHHTEETLKLLRKPKSAEVIAKNRSSNIAHAAKEKALREAGDFDALCRYQAILRGNAARAAKRKWLKQQKDRVLV